MSNMFSCEDRGEDSLPIKPSEEPANIHSEKGPMLNEDSIECLESVFKTVRYPSDSVIEYLADDLVVPMSTIKAWFRKRRGEGRKARRSVDGNLFNMNYEPHFGFGGLGLPPNMSASSLNQVDQSLSEMQLKMNHLNFEDKDEGAKDGSQGKKEENAIYIQDILGSLIQFCPMVSQDTHAEGAINHNEFHSMPVKAEDTRIDTKNFQNNTHST